MTDVTTLEQIYHMITPADVLGAQKLALGQKVDENYIKQLLDILYNVGSSGALSMDALAGELNKLLSKAPDDQLALVKQVISFFSSTGIKVDKLGTASSVATDTDGKGTVNASTFDQIVGKDNVLTGKTMGIILSNSAFLSPIVRNAERVERFMNFLPTIVASRMVPFLEVEFAFNRGIPTASTGKTAPRFWEPSLLKFLMGADQTLAADASTGTGKMLSLQETVDEKSFIANGEPSVGLHSVAGMEMFTSPQTLVNPNPVADGGRYVDVLDPFRPFMSIESFTVSVSPWVGLYSYKKGSLVLKLHDRSRLAEISDLLRPQIYQDSLSAPTLWLTYGWRHPAEPGNPYADFINGNMLVREAYGIINSSFSFDGIGQVQITLELWVKGMAELRTLRTNDDPDKDLGALRNMQQIAELIKRNSVAQGLMQAEGIGKEIRSTLLIEAAERGTFPDMSTPDIIAALAALKKSLLAKDAVVDQAAAASLVAELDKFYKSSDKKNLDFKTQIEKDATNATKEQFKEVQGGIDPFLPSTAQDAKNASENNGTPHPLTSLVEAINAYQGTADVKSQKSPVKGETFGLSKKAVSFGKIVSVFIAKALKSLDGIEEMQLFFYQLNDHAGAAANTNIASFPIDMPVFLDQYREHIERKGTERVTIEEFLKLLIDAQLADTRAIGYGFRSFFAPYDPKNKHDESFKDNTQQAYESAISGISSKQGPFQKPVIETFVETVYQTTDVSTDIDLLHRFESVTPQAGAANVNRAGHYRRIMRIHIFDKTNNPYKVPAHVLRGDSSASAALIEVPDKPSVYDAAIALGRTMLGQLSGDKVTSDGKIDSNASLSGKVVTNEQIKHYVSKMVPTIIFGGNASSVTSANLASKQDPLLGATQMLALKQGKPSVLQPNGGGAGGLPLRVIPAALTMTTIGCPLLTYAQMFFVDFNTGTTIDNIYGLSGITHTLTPGKFESNLTFAFYDAYGKYEGAPTTISYFLDQLKKATSG